VVDYNTGRSAHRDENGKVEEIRAVSALLYLANEEWHPGDGGETAIFDGADGGQAQPVRKIPPINNSILLFECTPFSFHTFLGNRIPRNCLVMWLHRPKAEVVRRWDDRSIAYWPKDGD
jgi:Rps23 Pro-64 3,4-dihydroxylase Tpa1-like proline 4-hydroxylase